MALLTSGFLWPWPPPRHTLPSCSDPVALRWLVVILILMVSGSAIADSEQQVTENRVKAAFLFKFGDYIQWPAGSFENDTTPIVIGVAGALELAQQLEQIIAGRTVKGRMVTVRQITSPEETGGVHILFVGRDSDLLLLGPPAVNPEYPILVVTESGDSPPSGSIINFVVSGNKVRFDIALESAKRRSLKINSRLLGVARMVLGGDS